MSAPTTAYAVTPQRVLHAEWHKLRTLRSTWWTLGLSVALVVGVGLMMGSTYDGDDANIDTVVFTLFGTQLSQICIAVLGILITASEYANGLVRATMAAVPRRLPVLWSKAAVFTAVAFAVTFATNVGTFLLAQIWLSDTDKALSLTDSGVLGALAGSAAGITLLSLIALGLGALCRSVPAAIGAFIGGVMILPEVLQMISFDPVQSAVKYFPTKSAEALGSITPVADHNGAGTGLVALVLWAAATLAAAALLLKRRDV
ncbi:ABC transporter permease [Streptomyces longispororuber]|uniref:ABC transporter permease n=1 Tax=Streptomyces longispororuber TaxID=68230 RepID=UPI00210B46FB|nr:ABC transporter permease [Streptomyces longispororuber]MCQ4214615.1 ABC transporter permease [Streptomyces longispororuber]